MIVLASQIVFCLVLAAAIGFLVAWFLRGAIERGKAKDISASWATLEPEVDALRRSVSGKEQEIEQLRTRVAAFEPMPRAAPEPAQRAGEREPPGLVGFGERKGSEPTARTGKRDISGQSGFGERRTAEIPHWMREVDKIEPRVSAPIERESAPSEANAKQDAVLRYMDEQIERLTARIADLEAAERKPGAPARPGTPSTGPKEDANKP
jgi:outer membrane murein-binding lipoprotein Lpp